MAEADDLKREAAETAADEVEDGMVLGLGTGSTIARFLEILARRLADGALGGIRGVPTSVRTSDECASLGIPLTSLDDDPVLDLAVDGADEVDPGLELIKGLGGALLREKVVAQAARRFVIIADGSKSVERLGVRAPLPVEVVPFAASAIARFSRNLGADPVLREEEPDAPYLTDNGNYVLDLRFAGGIPDPEDVEERIRSRAGVVETGLFLGMADAAYLARADGVTVLERGEGRP